MKKLLSLIFKITLALIFLLFLILALSYRSELSLEQLATEYTDEYSHFIKVDDIDMHVRVKGEGEPIFLIHGSFASLHTWEAWESELSQYFMTISMDLPGHGLTGPDELKRYGTADYADLLFQLADNLGIDEFHVAGNSMGGGVALLMATSQPERILTLNLIDASGAPARRVVADTSNIDRSQAPAKSGSSSVSIIRFAQQPYFSKVLLRCTPKWLFSQNMKQVYYDDAKIQKETVTRYYNMMRREGNRQATLDRLTTRKPYQVDFEKINMPVMIIWGREDTWISVSNAERFKEVIPDAYLKIFDRTGHVPMEERPTETVAEYLSFLGIQADRDYFTAPNYYSHVFR
ncbi:alpha/beta fold hydrolase [Belliella pelovolcani]|uniref:Pimeloyl-ACP methyl ester carboxylesterase n=1 Tax=Belliella pelovolcani TaxID=529505 RepID=A0A1N7LST6_9BACT|nr:alpha/beta hydrolase [Belliella pelovolcani]SIS76918.1 Pimeloyl-ACP methyl ester carboxylesterase [Belliella pelovolcani]